MEIILPRELEGVLDSDACAAAAAVLAAFEGAAFVFAHTAPDAGILAGFQCPVEALGGHWATVAYELRAGDL